MGLSKSLRWTISLTILGISILVWVLLLVNPGHIMTIEHCHVSAAGPSAQSLQMLLDMNPFSSQLLGWGLMVIAMMLPKLTMPVQFIYMRSLKRLRLVLSLLFIFGYTAMWMLAGVFMTALIMAFNLWFPMSYVPAIFVGLAALIWQFSPIKQRCLNLGHDHRNLPAFGWPALSAAFSFGVSHGVWCIGAGWLMMLFPMLLPQGHNLAMVMVTFLMISEHLEHPKLPRWNLDGRLKLFKILWAQVKIRISPTL